MRRVLLGLLVAIVAAIGMPVGAASAAQGSVPPVVASFVEDELLDRLTHHDPEPADAAGAPIDFSAASLGAIVRVHFFTEDSRAGRGVDDPVIARDEWAVPVLDGSTPIGTAMVTGDVEIPEIHLDTFVPDVALAAGVERLGPTAFLVHDPPTSSWFAFDERTVWPIVAGTSGVASARPLDRMDLDRQLPRVDPINPGTIGALLALSGLVAVGLLALAVPRLLRRRLDPDDPGEPEGRVAGERAIR